MFFLPIRTFAAVKYRHLHPGIELSNHLHIHRIENIAVASTIGYLWFAFHYCVIFRPNQTIIEPRNWILFSTRCIFSFLKLCFIRVAKFIPRNSPAASSKQLPGGWDGSFHPPNAVLHHFWGTILFLST